MYTLCAHFICLLDLMNITPISKDISTSLLVNPNTKKKKLKKKLSIKRRFGNCCANVTLRIQINKIKIKIKINNNGSKALLFFG